MDHKIPDNGNVIITSNSYSGGSRNFDRRQRVQVKSKKKVISSINHFLHTETGLASTTTSKSTHCPQFKAMFALYTTSHH